VKNVTEASFNFSKQYLDYCRAVIDQFDVSKFDDAAELIAKVRKRGGRLFVIGSGGGAGHASHAVCDFRKLCEIEAYAPYDNVSELTARANDDGWEHTLTGWLRISHLNTKDALFVFSVGGGDHKANVSMNLVNAMRYAKDKGAALVAVVGRNGGIAGELADTTILIAAVEPSLVTPLTEGFQALVWHLLVSHPALQVRQAKWESLKSDLSSRQ
jgi:D-sedoheptulose 7-phosphate isomerase